MMYDEHCFERHSEMMERDYLNREEMEERHTCCSLDCDSEAVMTINGDRYCAECGRQMIEEFGDIIEEISGYEMECEVPELIGDKI